MARISKSENAPQDPMHVTLGAVEFDLASDKTVFETDDAAIIANARQSPLLKVEIDPVAADAVVDNRDPLDPHVNPSADHLSAVASQDAIDSAAANEQAIKAATGGDVVAPTDYPTVQETVQSTFDIVNVDTAPQLPDVPVAPEPNAPGGGVTPNDAPTSTRAPGRRAASTDGEDS